MRRLKDAQIEGKKLKLIQGSHEGVQDALVTSSAPQSPDQDDSTVRYFLGKMKKASHRSV